MTWLLEEKSDEKLPLLSLFSRAAEHAYHAVHNSVRLYSIIVHANTSGIYTCKQYSPFTVFSSLP